jgi:Protein of unknown function (DUF3099)
MARDSRARKRAAPVRITTAPVSREEEIAHRQRRYIISMGIRTLCFIAAVLVGPGWLRWALVAASFVLPYVAVVMANSASPRIEGAALPRPASEHKELGGRDDAA